VGYSNTTNFVDPSWPDLYFILSGQGIEKSQAQASRVQGQKPGTFDKYYTPHVGKDAVIATIFLARPPSINEGGEIKLASNNHNDPPLIDPKYLKDPADVQAIIDGS